LIGTPTTGTTGSTGTPSTGTTGSIGTATTGTTGTTVDITTGTTGTFGSTTTSSSGGGNQNDDSNNSFENFPVYAFVSLLLGVCGFCYCIIIFVQYQVFYVYVFYQTKDRDPRYQEKSDFTTFEFEKLSQLKRDVKERYEIQRPIFLYENESRITESNQIQRNRTYEATVNLFERN